MKTSILRRAVLLRTSHFVPRTCFQPTGQGTGLGLSLSYDIVKAHSGDIKVNSEMGSGSTFCISLLNHTA